MTGPNTEPIDTPDSSFAESAMLLAMSVENAAADFGQRAATFWDTEGRTYALAAGAIILAGATVVAFGRSSK
jgi:hypothetical protein